MERKIEYLTEYNPDFEGNYLSVREKENRVYSDSTVLKLPYLETSHLQCAEWQLRVKTTKDFVNYLHNNSFNNVLDIGCGNGWFSNVIANNTNGSVLGLDVNKVELEQANRLFPITNLSFAYGDVFEIDFKQRFDLIVLNASIQYFSDIDMLIKRLKDLLASSGEIHVLDSPFYASELERDKAKQRTVKYYNELGHPEMSKFYFHHLVGQLKGFEVKSKPITNRVFKFIKGKYTPFSWYYFKE